MDGQFFYYHIMTFDLQLADIDECADQVLCHECQNTMGSYICLCNEGYTNSTTDGTSFFCEGEY